MTLFTLLWLKLRPTVKGQLKSAGNSDAAAVPSLMSSAAVPQHCRDPRAGPGARVRLAVCGVARPPPLCWPAKNTRVVREKCHNKVRMKALISGLWPPCKCYFETPTQGLSLHLTHTRVRILTLIKHLIQTIQYTSTQETKINVISKVLTRTTMLSDSSMV